MGNQWGDIYLCVPPTKMLGGRVPPSPHNRRPWKKPRFFERPGVASYCRTERSGMAAWRVEWSFYSPRAASSMLSQTPRGTWVRRCDINMIICRRRTLYVAT